MHRVHEAGFGDTGSLPSLTYSRNGATVGRCSAVLLVVGVLFTFLCLSRTLRSQCVFEDVETQMAATIVAQTADNAAWSSLVNDGFGFDLTVLDDGADSRVLLTDPYDNASISSFDTPLTGKFATFQPDFRVSVTGIAYIPAGDFAGNFLVLDADWETVPTSPQIGIMDSEGRLVTGTGFEPILGVDVGLETHFTAIDVSPDGTEIAAVDTLNNRWYILDLDFAVVKGPFPILGFPVNRYRMSLCWNSCSTVLIASTLRNAFTSSVALEYDVSSGEYTGRGLDFSSIGTGAEQVAVSGMDIGTRDGADVLFVYNLVRDAVFAVALEYSLFPGPVSALNGTRGPGSTDPLSFTWINDSPATYDTILVRQNGVQIAELPGTATRLDLPDSISGRSQFEFETRNADAPNPLLDFWVDTDNFAPPFATGFASGVSRLQVDGLSASTYFSFLGMDSRQVVKTVAENQIFVLFSADSSVRVISGDNTAFESTFPIGDVVTSAVFGSFIGVSIVTVDGLERLAILGLGVGGFPIAGIFESFDAEDPGATVQLILNIDLSAIENPDGVLFSDWDADSNGDLITLDLNNNRLVKIEHDFVNGTMTAVAEAPLPQCALLDCSFDQPLGAVSVLGNGYYLVTGGGFSDFTSTRAYLSTPFHDDARRSVQFTGHVQGLLVAGDLQRDSLGIGIGMFNSFGLTATYYDLEESPQAVTFYPSPSTLSIFVTDGNGDPFLVGGDLLGRIFNLNKSPTHPDLVAEQLADETSTEPSFKTAVGRPSFRFRAERLDYHYHVANRSEADATVTVNPLLDGLAVFADTEVVIIPSGASIYRSITDRTEGAIEVSIVNPGFAEIQVLVGVSGVASGSARPVFKRGDFDVSGVTDFNDALRLLGFLFVGDGFPPTTCRDAGDADNNGSLELNDALVVLKFLFLGAFEIPTPGVQFCGPDPGEEIVAGLFQGVGFQPGADDEAGAPFEEGPLGCDSYEACD